MSAVPSFSTTLVMVSITMRRYGSDSSLRSSTTRPTISVLPTLSDGLEDVARPVI